MASEPSGPDAEIARLRSRLLGGRGPGATPAELAPFMHDRPALGALPTMVERERVQLQTDLARGDPAALEGHASQVRTHLSRTLDQLADRISASRMVGGAAGPGGPAATVGSFAAGAVVAALLVIPLGFRRRRARRATDRASGAARTAR